MFATIIQDNNYKKVVLHMDCSYQKIVASFLNDCYGINVKEEHIEIQRTDYSKGVFKFDTYTGTYSAIGLITA